MKPRTPKAKKMPTIEEIVRDAVKQDNISKTIQSLKDHDNGKKVISTEKVEKEVQKFRERSETLPVNEEKLWYVPSMPSPAGESVFSPYETVLQPSKKSSTLWYISIIAWVIVIPTALYFVLHQHSFLYFLLCFLGGAINGVVHTYYLKR